MKIITYHTGDPGGFLYRLAEHQSGLGVHFAALAVLFKLFTDKLLYFLQNLDVVLSHNGDGPSLLTSPRCSSHAMDVVFAVRWNIKVNHKVNIWNIKASTRHIGCYQDVSISRLEFVEGS